MRFILLLLASVVMVACASGPKYKVGDCVNMAALGIDEDGLWNSAGYHLGAFKVISYYVPPQPVYTPRSFPEGFYRPRFQGRTHYVVRMIDFRTGEMKGDDYIIPISDLDNFRYADVFWELPEEVKYRCNRYEKSK